MQRLIFYLLTWQIPWISRSCNPTNKYFINFNVFINGKKIWKISSYCFESGRNFCTTKAFWQEITIEIFQWKCSIGNCVMTMHLIIYCVWSGMLRCEVRRELMSIRIEYILLRIWKSIQKIHTYNTYNNVVSVTLLAFGQHY